VWRLVVALGVLGICALVGEGAAGDWSAVYLRDNLGTSAGFAALGFAAFSVTMTAGRLVGDRLIRGRIDAVFADAPGGGYDVVDWKTGQPPRSEAERHAVSVQLAAYRLAWAALAGVPVTAVRAAFYYVRQDLTLRPADLLDEAGLAGLIEQIPAAG